jgi:hypothetical protein
VAGIVDELLLAGDGELRDLLRVRPDLLRLDAALVERRIGRERHGGHGGEPHEHQQAGSQARRREACQAVPGSRFDSEHEAQ